MLHSRESLQSRVTELVAITWPLEGDEIVGVLAEAFGIRASNPIKIRQKILEKMSLLSPPLDFLSFMLMDEIYVSAYIHILSTVFPVCLAFTTLSGYIKACCFVAQQQNI